MYNFVSVDRARHVVKCNLLCYRDSPNLRITLVTTMAAKSYDRWPTVSFPIIRVSLGFSGSRGSAVSAGLSISVRCLLCVRGSCVVQPAHVNGQKQRTCKRVLNNQAHARSTITIYGTYWSRIEYFYKFLLSWTISTIIFYKSFFPLYTSPCFFRYYILIYRGCSFPSELFQIQFR